MAVRRQGGTRGGTRERILREAERLFAARGFEGTGMEQIAAKVGIRKSVIYYHFRNKRQVLQTLLDEFVDRGVAFKKQLFARYGDAFMDSLEQAMGDMVEFLEANRRIVTILLMESIKSSREVPLLEVMDFRSPAALEVIEEAREHRIRTAEAFTADPQAMLEAFFMLNIPVIGYVVFGDKWCERSGLDRQASRKSFIEAFLWFFRERSMKRERFGNDRRQR